MDENFKYNSSDRPDIDAAWQQLEQLLDKEKPAAGGRESNNKGRWGLALLLMMISGLIIWNQSNTKNTKKNVNNSLSKRNSQQNTDSLKDANKDGLGKYPSSNNNSFYVNKKFHNMNVNKSKDKANADTGLITGDSNLQPTDEGISIAQKDNISVNRFNNATVNGLRKSNGITKNTFKDYVPGFNSAKVNTNDGTPEADDPKGKSVSDDFVKANKDTIAQSSIITDSAKVEKKIPANNFAKDSTGNTISATAIARGKTKKEKKKNNVVTLQASLSAGISPSLSFQHTGYANSSGLNYLAAVDFFVTANIPLSKRFTLQAALHPFAGVPLRSDKWKQSFQNLDETQTTHTIGHTITTFTSAKITTPGTYTVTSYLHHPVDSAHHHKANIFYHHEADSALHHGTGGTPLHIADNAPHHTTGSAYHHAIDSAHHHAIGSTPPHITNSTHHYGDSNHSNSNGSDAIEKLSITITIHN
jgi:hypothetical protein